MKGSENFATIQLYLALRDFEVAGRKRRTRLVRRYLVRARLPARSTPNLPQANKTLL